jgi:hypothetical protein
MLTESSMFRLRRVLASGAVTAVAAAVVIVGSVTACDGCGCDIGGSRVDESRPCHRWQ